MQEGSAFRARRMSAFEVYLRTGKRPSPAGVADGVEVKFNPWHDPDDGRFTFKGQGAHYGNSGGRTPKANLGTRLPRGASGGDGSTKVARQTVRPSAAAPAQNRVSHWIRGGFHGGGGGDFKGGGATGDWNTREAPKTAKRGVAAPTPQKIGAVVAGSAPGNLNHSRDARQPATRQPSRIATIQTSKRTPNIENPYREVEKNGYRFKIDDMARTRRIEGSLQNVQSQRSRTNQARAGGSDRLPSDDGGHFVAVRFNGPSDSFNHFPQDSRVNRGSYRVMEDNWAKEVKAGRTVHVNIVPHYSGASQRPDSLDVTWYIDGDRYSRTIENPKGKKDGR